MFFVLREQRVFFYGPSFSRQNGVSLDHKLVYYHFGVGHLAGSCCKYRRNLRNAQLLAQSSCKNLKICARLEVDTFLYHSQLPMTCMIETVHKDSIASYHMSKSSLTEVQLDTILASHADGKLDEKVSLRNKHKVSKGSFVRSLRQGQQNIEASLHTLILVQYLGLVDPVIFSQLGRVAELIARVRSTSPDKDSIQRIIETIQGVAEEFSSRRRFIS